MPSRGMIVYYLNCFLVSIVSSSNCVWFFFRLLGSWCLNVWIKVWSHRRIRRGKGRTSERSCGSILHGWGVRGCRILLRHCCGSRHVGTVAWTVKLGSPELAAQGLCCWLPGLVLTHGVIRLRWSLLRYVVHQVRRVLGKMSLPLRVLQVLWLVLELRAGHLRGWVLLAWRIIVASQLVWASCICRQRGRCGRPSRQGLRLPESIRAISTWRAS